MATSSLRVFLPKPLATLLTAYLALVRPVEVYACRCLRTEQNHDIYNKKIMNYSLYLSVQNGVVMTGDKLSSLLAKYTLNIIQARLTLRMYRQIAIAFMDKKIRHFSKDAAIVENMLAGRPDSSLSYGRKINPIRDLFDEQAGHTRSVANTAYAYSNKDQGYMSRKNMASYYLCSLKWHNLLSKYL